MSLKDNWNPRFIQFCRSKGIQNPADFIAEDNRMTEFVTWNDSKIAEFKKVSPQSFFQGRYWSNRSGLKDFAAYNKWLAEQYGEIE